MESCATPRGASQVKTAAGAKKRALTQARREQNRAAQKIYREKQKKLREGLQSRQRRDPARPLYVELRPRRDSDSTIPSSIVAAAAASSLDEYDSDPSLFATDYTWEQQGDPSTSITNRSTVDTPLASSSSSSSNSSATSSSSLSPLLYQGYPSISSFPSLYLADPYANARPLSQTAIFTALLRNALSLGFDLAALADCAHPYACLSPFYSPTATAQDDPHQLVEDALGRAAAAMTTPIGNKAEAAAVAPPASLRPTLAQILVPHHASLDLIPFPQFRDRVILLSAALPHQFNLTELKTDIYVSGALRVATGTVDDGHGNSSTVGSRRSRQPWEPRSWEVSGWFLRKWSLAIDDGSREMLREVA